MGYKGLKGEPEMEVELFTQGLEPGLWLYHPRHVISGVDTEIHTANQPLDNQTQPTHSHREKVDKVYKNRDNTL